MMMMNGFMGVTMGICSESGSRDRQLESLCVIRGELGSFNHGLSRLLRLLRLGLALLCGGVVIGVHRDLDRDGSATDLLALESQDGLLLLLLAANVDEAVALALAGLAPTAAHDARGLHFNARVSEERGKTGVVDVETEVGDEEHGLGRIANGVLASRAGLARCTGLALLGLLLRLSGAGLAIGGGRLTIGRLALRLALGGETALRSRVWVHICAKVSTYGLLLLLGLGRVA